MKHNFILVDDKTYNYCQLGYHEPNTEQEMFNPGDNLVRLTITAISLFLGRGSNEPCDRLPPNPKVSEKKELEPIRLSPKPMLLIKHKNEWLFLRDKLSRRYCRCSGE